MINSIVKIFYTALFVLFLTGCLSKEKINNLAEAENQIITAEGRHFFTSSKGIAELYYEYGQKKLSFIETDCDTLNGIVSTGDWLIAVCADSKLISPIHRLIKIDLSNINSLTHKPTVSTLFELTDIALPNGLVMTPNQDAVLIANYNLLGQGFISRLELNHSYDDLSAGNFDLKYLSQEHGIASANGIKFYNNDLYVSDFQITTASSRIVKIRFIADEYLDHQVLYSANTILDDLLPTCDGVLVSDYLFGRLIFISKYGKVSKSSLQQFPGITSIAWGQTPLFPEKTLVITERGILNDRYTLIGNQISSSAISDRVLMDVGANCSHF
jgi:hypothetical protein